MDNNVNYPIVAIPASDTTVDAPVAKRFARAPYFAIYHHDSLEFTFVKNQAGSPNGHTGVAAAKQLIDLHVDTVLVPDIGAKAFTVLHKQGIPVHRYTKDYTIRDALYELYERKLGQIVHHTDPHFVE